MFPRLDRHGAGPHQGGGGDPGLHVRDISPAGRDQVGRGDLQQTGPRVLQVLATVEQ